MLAGYFAADMTDSISFYIVRLYFFTGLIISIYVTWRLKNLS